MKKLLSVLLTVVLLAAMLSAFAVPASASYKDAPPRELTSDNLWGICGKCIISVPGDYTVSELSVLMGGSLIIGKGVHIMVEDEFYNAGSIEVRGTLELLDCYLKASTNDLTTAEGGKIIGNSGMDTLGTYGDLPGWNDDQIGGYIPDSWGSVLSNGSLVIIVGVAAAVIFGLGGFFIGKSAGKKKRERNS